MTTTVNNIRTSLPNALIVVCGTYDPLGVNGSPYTTIGAALLAAATALGVPYVEPATGVVYDGAGNAVLTDGPWITTTNKAVMIGGDNVHQTDLGQKYMAYRMYNAVRALLPA